jgi:hypothetical protein
MFGLVILAGCDMEFHRNFNPNTPTLAPSPIPMIVFTASPWPTIRSQEMNCIRVSAVTVDMEGEKVCAYGKVARIVSLTDAWQIRFTGSFFLAGGAFYYPEIKEDDCVYAEGDVLLSSENIPYINIDEDNLYYCRSWMQ